MSDANRPPPPLPSFMAVAERKAREEAQPLKASQVDLHSPINVERVDRNINESLRKQIVDIINNHPDIALSIVRGWKDRRD